MDIGHVLLRDAQYVWRERTAVLEKDAVVLRPPPSAWQAAVAAVGQPKKKQKPKPRLKTKSSKLRTKTKTSLPAEVLPLDGSLSCEAVVVSSAHMHSVKLQDLRSGREFLVDVTTKGKRQMWVDLFSSARGRVNITGSWRRKLQSLSTEKGETTVAEVRTLTLLDLQQAVEMLIAATETETVAVCGYDVESILLGDGSAADFTETQAVEIAQRLVEEGVLIPFCCSNDGDADMAFQLNPTVRRGSAMNLTSQDCATIALTRTEEAEVHSFRLAIAQAAHVPVGETCVFSDEYLFSVLRVKNRSFSYAVTKMARIVEWRRSYDVEAIKWDDVKSQLTSGNMYWYGYDFENRPILWVRAKLKDWSTMSNRRAVEVRAHVYLLELGCRRFMPPGCTTYTIVTDSAGLGVTQVDIRLMRGLLDVCVANFPDRIGLVHAGPLTRFLKYIISWLWPFLPVRLRSKVSLMHDCAAELSKYMKAELIPLHMGGAAMHNLCEPSEPPTGVGDAMDITYMIDQQKRFMEELKIC
ncbi:hypothetical protein BBJ29_003590 [Phytophthora kernoviae]|uniref:CRAL-TRIO domain-containing protein n=1 Tax=Phytophthora kernoviae TaxID=325452 RepID=A0A3F2RT97_9STRA|nr:hypothetical protein BBP00_00004425 [Phytophthora kernoviae]RLN65495.1 hypothetical protein BBJ29_003590 [Phytophthora kernoviae]